MYHTIKIALALWMGCIIGAAFGWTEPAEGFYGQTSRILFFHVPQAWVATLAFLLSLIGSVIFLTRKHSYADHLALAAAELGFVFSILATVTGSLFAKVTWGSFWNWDPRETSMVILLLIYGAYFALRSAISDVERKKVFAAVYAILAFATVPFLVFIVPRITLSLHPEDTMDPADPGMDPRTLLVFLGALGAYSGLFVWMLRLKMRVLRLRACREAMVLLKRHNVR